jgi:hypothetical protein
MLCTLWEMSGHYNWQSLTLQVNGSLILALPSDAFQHYWLYSVDFFLVSWGGVSPLGTTATNWPIVLAPDDRWWVWSSRWNETWQGKPEYSEITCPSATLFTTNSTWPDLGSNPDRRGGKPATNRLSYGKAKRRILGLLRKINRKELGKRRSLYNNGNKPALGPEATEENQESHQCGSTVSRPD